MKREFITGLLPGIDRASLDRIMDEHGRDLRAQRAQLEALTAERDALRQELEGLGGENAGSLQAALGELQARYDRDTAELHAQLDDAAYRAAVREASSELRFTSRGARRAFEEELIKKRLPIEDGCLQGLPEFTAACREADPGAFAPPDKTPVLTRGSGTGIPAAQSGALRAAFGLPDYN